MFSVFRRAAVGASVNWTHKPAFLRTGTSTYELYVCAKGLPRQITTHSVGPENTHGLNLRDAISNTERSMEDIEAYLNTDEIAQEVQHTEAVLEDPQLWVVNPAGALTVQKRLSDMQHKLSTRRQFRSTLDRLKELAAMAERAEDTDLGTAVFLQLQGLQQSAKQQMTSILLSDPMDQNSAYITIRAGSGDTEDSEWASTLVRMYTKWAQSRNFAVKTVEEIPDDVAGTSQTILLIEGPYAYGYAQYESGIHRLLHHLPSSGDRGQHTSCASVRVSPLIDDDIPAPAIDFELADVQITVTSTQRTGGHLVENAASAVRVVHLPTGITASCQHEGSQHRNRICALSLLRAKLYDMELEKRVQSAADTSHALPANEWSSQIRTYTLQPPQSVRDARTEYEVKSDAVQSVLDGDLGGFMEASLRKFKKKA